eukprot:6199935-Pleurochrysis_carterae.AAC.5
MPAEGMFGPHQQTERPRSNAELVRGPAGTDVYGVTASRCQHSSADKGEAKRRGVQHHLLISSGGEPFAAPCLDRLSLDAPFCLRASAPLRSCASVPVAVHEAAHVRACCDLHTLQRSDSEQLGKRRESTSMSSLLVRQIGSSNEMSIKLNFKNIPIDCSPLRGNT